MSVVVVSASFVVCVVLVEDDSSSRVLQEPVSAGLAAVEVSSSGLLLGIAEALSMVCVAAFWSAFLLSSIVLGLIVLMFIVTVCGGLVRIRSPLALPVSVINTIRSSTCACPCEFVIVMSSGVGAVVEIVVGGSVCSRSSDAAISCNSMSAGVIPGASGCNIYGGRPGESATSVVPDVDCGGSNHVGHLRCRTNVTALLVVLLLFKSFLHLFMSSWSRLLVVVGCVDGISSCVCPMLPFLGIKLVGFNCDCDLVFALVCLFFLCLLGDGSSSSVEIIVSGIGSISWFLDLVVRDGVVVHKFITAMVWSGGVW